LGLDQNDDLLKRREGGDMFWKEKRETLEDTKRKTKRFPATMFF